MQDEDQTVSGGHPKTKRPRRWRVKKPVVAGECWAHLKNIMGVCWRPARPGKLTCASHWERESEAMEFAAEFHPMVLIELSLRPRGSL